jgi:signal transduction histidine kinase
MINISEEPLLVEADTVRIGQVVANLLNNAAKYTPSGGRIELSAYRDNEEAVITVNDNGMGIPEESLANVFDMFNQVGRNMDRSQGGLGIGLSLVRRLVEMHGGTVNATSVGAGQGSTFIVRLPLTLMQGVEDTQPVQQAVLLDQRQERKLKILVVDDNVDAAEILSTMLELHGHVTRVAHGIP